MPHEITRKQLTDYEQPAGNSSIIVFLREVHTNWLPYTKWSASKTNMQVTLCTLSKLHLGIYILYYMYMYMYIV